MRRIVPRTLMLCAAVLLGSCKGEPTGPRVETLHVVSASARPYESLEARIRGATIPASGVTGRFGALDVAVSRADDTTLVVVVPALSAGPHELSVTMGDKTWAGTVQVLPALAIPSPQVHIDTTIATVEALTAALETRMLSSTTRPAGVDSAAFIAQLASFRATLDDVKAAWAAASPADRQAVAAILAANSALFGLDGSQDDNAFIANDILFAGPADCDRVNPFLITTNREAKQLWATLAVVGVVSWGASPAGRLLGVAVSALIVKKFILAKQEQIWKHLIAPCVAALLDESGESVVGQSVVAAAATPVIFVGGEAKAIVIEGQYRSITASDASLGGPIGVIIGLFNEFRSIWNDLVSLIPLMQAPAPQLPATPARKEMHPIPAAQLALGSISPSGITSSATASGNEWMLKFDKPGFGKDIDMIIGVRFTPPGMPTQTKTRSAVLTPKIPPVASVTIPLTGTVARQATLTLDPAPIVKDSMSRVLLGRTLFFSSSATDIATVNPTTGVITGVTTGTAIITVRASGTVNDTARATMTVTVVDHKVVIAPKTVSIEAGKTGQFTATVTGTTNTGVTWSATGGTISSSGVFTAGTTTGTFRAVAITNALPARADTATVTITAPDSTAIYRQAVLGMWTVSNSISGGSSTYQAELFETMNNSNGPTYTMKYYTPTQDAGNGTRYCPNGPAPVNNRCEYGASWWITKSAGRYYLQDAGFWHSAYGSEARDPLTMPVGSFKTYSGLLGGAASRTFTR